MSLFCKYIALILSRSLWHTSDDFQSLKWTSPLHIISESCENGLLWKGRGAMGWRWQAGKQGSALEDKGYNPTVPKPGEQSSSTDRNQHKAAVTKLDLMMSQLWVQDSKSGSPRCQTRHEHPCSVVQTKAKGKGWTEIQLLDRPEGTERVNTLDNVFHRASSQHSCCLLSFLLSYAAASYEGWLWTQPVKHTGWKGGESLQRKITEDVLRLARAIRIWVFTQVPGTLCSTSDLWKPAIMPALIY